LSNKQHTQLPVSHIQPLHSALPICGEPPGELPQQREADDGEHRVRQQRRPPAAEQQPTRRPGNGEEREQPCELAADEGEGAHRPDRKSTRLNSSQSQISYAVFCLKKKKPSQGALLDSLPPHVRPVADADLPRLPAEPRALVLPPAFTRPRTSPLSPRSRPALALLP